MYPLRKSSVSSRQRDPVRGGFTLIELMMVVAVILILAGITFGISRGVQNAQARAKARAELAVLAQALEQFKVTYGDYPWTTGTDATTNGQVLFTALAGWKEFKKDADSGDISFTDKTSVPSNGPKAFVDPTKLSYSSSKSGETLSADPRVKPSNFYYTDPWGNKYVYLYGKTSPSNQWEAFGYYLYSLGPDGTDQVGGIDSTTGVMQDNYRQNSNVIDNIYAGE